MRVLVVGGTNFIGPHVVQALLAAGHDVTVFNRGKTDAELPADVTRLTGDRVQGDLAALAGAKFDATIDMCAYFPRAVDAVLDALADPGFYCFISTISVYASFSDLGQDESAPVHVLDDPETEEVTGETYGGLKVLCEQVVERRTSACAILRLGLVVGPGDVTDRFSYWPVRTAAGGTMLAPGSPDDAMQWIDARDVAAFAVRTVEEKICGTFNLVTTPGEHTLGEVIDIAQRVSGADTDVVWLSAEQLEEHELKPWVDFPAWLPPDGDDAGFAAFDNSRALAAGLRPSSTEFTVKSLLDWWGIQDVERRQLRTGLDRGREAEIIANLRNNEPIVSVAEVRRTHE